MILSIICSDFKEFKIWLRNFLFYQRQSFKMSLAIKMADIKQMAWNKQFHVMLLSLPAGEKLVSVNRDDILRFIRKKWLPKNTDMFRLVHGNSVFYSTPLNRNNKSTPKERRKAREKYMNYSRKYMK